MSKEEEILSGLALSEIEQEQLRLIRRAMDFSFSHVLGKELPRFRKEHGVQRGLFPATPFYEKEKIPLNQRDIEILYEKTLERMPEDIEKLSKPDDSFSSQQVIAWLDDMPPEEKRAVFDDTYPELLEYDCTFPGPPDFRAIITDTMSIALIQAYSEQNKGDMDALRILYDTSKRAQLTLNQVSVLFDQAVTKTPGLLHHYAHTEEDQLRATELFNEMSVSDKETMFYEIMSEQLTNVDILPEPAM